MDDRQIKGALADEVEGSIRTWLESVWEQRAGIPTALTGFGGLRTIEISDLPNHGLARERKGSE